MSSKYFKKAVENTPNHIKIFASKSLDIVDRIYFILEQKGMTQKDFAKILGKQESEVSKILTGGHNLTLKTISKIEDALGESIILIPKNTIQIEEVQISSIDELKTETVPDTDTIKVIKPQQLFSMLGGKKINLNKSKVKKKKDQDLGKQQKRVTKKGK